jgi:O-methyltransferase
MMKQNVKKIINGSLNSRGLRLWRTDLKQVSKRVLPPLAIDLGRWLLKLRITPPASDEQTVLPWKHDYLLQKYKTLITEVEGCLAEYVFPNLLPCPGRIDLMTKLLGTPIGEAFYIIAHLQKSLNLSGDVCEFGVAQGATSALLANEIRSTEKTLWLFDSFKGLGKHTEKDLLIDDIFDLGTIDKYQGKMASRVEEVESRLKAISFSSSRVKIIPGFIEDTIKYANLPEKVCFAYVDFDFHSPISIALRFLNEHLVVGGFIVVDDYGFFSSGAKTAVDEFLGEYRHIYATIVPSQFANQSAPFVVLRKRA